MFRHDLAPYVNPKEFVESRPKPTSVSLWICSVSFPGTTLDSNTVLPRCQITATSKNDPGSPNLISPAALYSFVGQSFSRKELTHWAQAGNNFVVLGWRLSEELPEIRTSHCLTPSGSDDFVSVVFGGSMAWAWRIATHISSLGRTQECSAEAASPTAKEAPRSCTTARGIGAVTKATRRPSHRGRRTGTVEASHRLLEARARYGNDKFRATGDTSEFEKALELSRAMAISHLQQQPKR